MEVKFEDEDMVIRGRSTERGSNGDLEIEQLDVKTTFLHGDLDEDIYMEQLEGFV